MGKILALICSFLVVSVMAQDPPFHVDGNIKNSALSKPEAGVTVEVVQNGKTILSTTSATNGKYDLKGAVDYKFPFEVVFSKSGFYSKKISFDYSQINPEDFPAGDVSPWKNAGLDMIPKTVAADLSFLEVEPVAKFKNGPDNGYIQKMQAKISNALAQSEQNEKKYQTLITEADNLYNQKKYADALLKYEGAVAIKPTEKHPNDRILEIDALLQAEKEKNFAAQQADQEYQNLIKAADALRDQKKYDLAVAKYQEALTKKDEQYPKDQIAALKKQAETDKAYNDAVKLADIYYNQKSYQMARDKFQEANKLKPDEPYPLAKLKDLESKLNAEKAAADKKLKYQEASDAGDALLKQEKWAEAKAKYQEALTFEPDATYPVEQIKVCDAKITELAKAKEKQEKITKLLAEGQTLYGQSKWTDSRAKYAEVLTLDAENAEAKQKIADLDAKIKADAENAEKAAVFAKLVTEGDAAVKAAKLADAKTKYEEALKIKADAAVQTKLDDVNKQLGDQQAAAELKKKYDDAKAEADALFKSEKWAEAKTKYSEAQQYAPKETYPAAQIKICDDKLAAEASAAEKKKQIEALLAEGETLLTAQKIADAKAKYNDVLKLDAANATAKAKLDEIAKIEKENQSKAELEAKFTKLVSEGDAAVASVKLTDAKTKYEEALKLKADPAVQTKLDNVNNALADQQKTADQKKKYADALSAADALFAAGKWADAKAKYTEAGTFYVDENGVMDGGSLPKHITQIKICDEKLAADAAAAEKKQQIENLLSEGQSLLTAKKYDDATAKYNEVLKIDASNATAKAKLEEITAAKKGEADAAALAAKNAQINGLLSEGESLLTAKKYDDATAKYNEVLKIDASNATAKAKLEEIATAKKGEADAAALAAKNAQINGLLSEGESLLTAKKYDDATAKYNEVLKIDASNATAKAKLEEITAAKKGEADAAALAAKNAQINGLLSEGESLLAAKKYDDATAKYNEVLKIDASNATAKAKLEEITAAKKGEADAAALAAKNAQINGLLSEGESLLTAKKYDDATAKYNEVLKIDASNATAKAKLEEITAAKKGEADAAALAAKNAQINGLLSEGESLLTAKKYDDATAKYNEVLKIDASNATAKAKLEEITAAKKGEADAAALAAKNAQINGLLSEGESLLTAKKYDDATAKYNEVLKIDASNATAKAKLEEITAAKKGEADAAALADKNAKVNAFLAEGENYLKAQKLEEAKTAYNNVLVLDPSNATAKSKIEEITKLQAESAAMSAQAEKTKQIEALMKEGDLLFGAGKLDEAKTKYNAILAIDANNYEAKDKLNEIAKKETELKSALELDKQIAELVKQGDDQATAENYLLAKSKYEEAKALRNDKLVSDRIADVNKKIEAQGEALNKRYKSEIEEADALFKAGKYAEAKEKYQYALTTEEKIWNQAKATGQSQSVLDGIESTKKYPQQQIDLCTKNLKGVQQDAELQKAYDELMVQAKTEETAGNLSSALAKYKEASMKKPDESLPKTKIAELEAKIEKQEEINQKYNTFLQSGKDLMAQQKYVEAISEFNKALEVKADGKEAADLAKQAEQLSRDKTDEVDKAYEKILTTATSKIEEKDYKKARELLERAKGIKPEDNRPVLMLKQLDDLERVEREYNASVQEGEKLAAAADYKSAIVAFEKAQSLKPTEPVPPKRIGELSQLMINAGQNKRYNELMAQGAENVSGKKYTEALTSYNNALTEKPGDKTATDKIAEVKQLMEDEAKGKKENSDKLIKINNLMIAGKKAFDNADYQTAIDKYTEVLAIDPGNKLAKDQLKESKSRLKNSQNSKTTKAYNALIKAGDDQFKISSYDKARENYTKAMDLKPNDPYAKKKLEEIDAILNPPVTEVAKLNDLGDPFDQSLEEAQAALQKAEMDRKSLKAEAVDTKIEETAEAERQKAEEAAQSQEGNMNEIHTAIVASENRDEKADENRQQLVENLKDDQRVLAEAESEKAKAEHDNMYNVESEINEKIKQNGEQYGEKESVYLVNGEAADELLKKEAEKARLDAEKQAVKIDNSTVYIHDNTLKAAELTEAGNESPMLNNEVVKSYESENALINGIKQEQAEEESQVNTAYANYQSAVQEERNAENKDRQYTIAESVRDTERSLEAEAIATYEEETLKYLKNNNAANNAAIQQENMKAKGYELQDQNAVLTDDIDRLTAIAATERELNDDEQRNNQVNEIHASTLKAEEDNAASYAVQEQNQVDVVKIEQSTLNAQQQQQLSDDDQREASRVYINNTVVKTAENNTEATNRQNENAEDVKRIEKETTSVNDEKEKTQETVIQANSSVIKDAETYEKKNVIVANSLGAEYPEGVTEESFTRSDANGLLVAIITRRVVVIEGRGDVFVRTQTLSSVTYTKNNVPVSESVWQSETQNPKLIKHKKP